VIIWSDFTNSGAIPHTTFHLLHHTLSVPRAMAGVLIAATGFPVYWLWKGRHGGRAAA